jgi:leader peptidase (prepilin peptidase)/N-methyltransferase
MDFLELLPLIFLFAVVFVGGALIGSFLNVCVARLPQEKSLLWPPGSRCGKCFQPVRWYDNIPLVSYWVLRGRCRSCGERFSIRYFLVELVTALGFAGLFYLVVVVNVHQLPPAYLHGTGRMVGTSAPTAWIYFAHHAILFCFLLVVALCDLDRREIPLSVTFTGTAFGLVLAMFLPWPWPYDPAPAVQVVPPGNHWLLPGIWRPPPEALWSWPIWWPLPAWLGLGGNWQTGLMTALAGMFAGTVLLRVVRRVFTAGLGIEALGLGDADLMMMAGSFLGWQPVLVAFFISPFAALVVTAGQYCWALIRPTIKVKVLFDGNDKPVYRVAGLEAKPHHLVNVLAREASQTGRHAVWIYGPATMEETVATVERAAKQTPVRRVYVTNLLPFGPSLAVGVLVTCLYWHWFAWFINPLAFHGPLLAILAGAGVSLMLVMSYCLRLARWLRNG